MTDNNTGPTLYDVAAAYTGAYPGEVPADVPAAMTAAGIKPREVSR